MSNIERKYAYYDQGVLPATGEYGITYLTLYSSGAGNVYDGWIYDPENKIPVSATERTFGFRNPTYPQYCWDDEVVVDLSNAQSREEASESAQGRITSFNTNVSSLPILLQDIDTSEMTESQRESAATTVLFTAIPLVKDAYIHAEVEVAMKMNLSEDNTTGNMKVEAFYILNDESDRTMRPHPINHYVVKTEDEWNLLRLLYWNPALKHETNNYIGVKLIATGGTAEIGISDNPEYGDAIITLISGGINGDVIYSGQPVSLEIFGREEVPMGYRLDPDDYTVLCTYDTGEIYDVTKLCTYDPEMWSELTEQYTTLVATYQGLTASMIITLAQVDHIELMGNEFIYDSYTFDINDYTVLAYFDNGDFLDVTDLCTFSPAMGTTVTTDTTLVATFEPEYMPGSVFSDSLNLEAVSVIATAPGELGGLQYTLYSNDVVRITGNSEVTTSGMSVYEYIALPVVINSRLLNRNKRYSLEWAATGDVSGFYLPARTASSSASNAVTVDRFINFDDISIKPYIRNKGSASGINANPIVMNFSYQSRMTSDNLSFLNNISYPVISNIPVTMSRTKQNTSDAHSDLDECFNGCSSLTNLDFLSNWEVSDCQIVYMFNGCTSLTDISPLADWGPFWGSVDDLFCKCTSLNDISPLSNWDVSVFNSFNSVFSQCSSLSDITPLADWDVSSATEFVGMFERCTSLKSVQALSGWRAPLAQSVAGMFNKSGIESMLGLSDFMLSCGSNVQGNLIHATFVSETKLKDLVGLPSTAFSVGKFTPVEMFMKCTELETLQGAESLDVSGCTSLSSMFNGCTKLSNISAIEGWDVSNIETFTGMFSGDTLLYDISPLILWDMSSATTVTSMLSTITRSIKWADIMSYECPSNLFSTLPTSLADNKIFVFDSLSRFTISSKISPSGAPAVKDYRCSNGIFGERDVFELVKLSSTSYTVNFVNPDGSPDWYRQKIKDYIESGNFYPK